MSNERPIVLTEVPPGEEAVMGFFNLSGAGLAIETSNFTQKELVDIMITHIRSGDDKVAQAGIKQFLTYAEKMATLNGRIGKAHLKKETNDDQGNTTTQTISQTSLTNRLISSAPPASIPAGKEFLPAQVRDPGRKPAAPHRKDPPPLAP